jgi:hypothetical protein
MPDSVRTVPFGATEDLPGRAAAAAALVAPPATAAPAAAAAEVPRNDRRLKTEG